MSGRFSVIASAVAALMSLSACGGSDGTNGTNGTNGVNGAPGANGLTALVLTSAEPPGSRCAAGGVRIDAGLDANRNGTLEAAEIGSTQYVCGGGSGATGPTGPAGASGLSTLVLMRDEPAGANCASGGKKIEAGLDADRNGVLSVAEVTATAYLCNGANGSAGADGKTSLMVTATEPAGANCAAGGIKVGIGLDANGNGQLDAAEVSATNYLCNGTNGAAGSNGRNSLIATVTEPAGANCAAGGIKITTGLDANGNGTLDAGEVSSTAYACNGALGATGPQGPTGPTGATGPAGLSTLVRIDAEPAGANCAFGGTRITSGLDSNRNGLLDAGEVTATSYVCNGGSGGLTWQNVTGTAVTAQPNTGYLANNATARVTVTLPPNGALAVGDIVAVTGIGGGGWKIAQNDGQTIVGAAAGAAAGANWTPRESNRAWRSVASSADGTRLVAAGLGTPIYTSTDGGVTWTARAFSANWSAVASSADGTRLVAGTATNVYISTDGGLTWEPKFASAPGRGNVVSIASSGDGLTLVVVFDFTGVILSRDGGATWEPRVGPATLNAVAISADGTKSAIVGRSPPVLVTSDGFATLSNAFAPPNTADFIWTSVALTPDGNKLVAVANGRQIYISPSLGATWLPPRESNRAWRSVATSADGGRLVAAVDGGQIYTSSDGGATWTPRESNRAWRSVASSADGTRLVAVADGGQIYTSVGGTTLGTGGEVSGNLDTAVELQYRGGGVFAIRSFAGPLRFQ